MLIYFVYATKRSLSAVLFLLVLLPSCTNYHKPLASQPSIESSLWPRLINNFHLTDTKHQRIQKLIDYYHNKNWHFKEISHRAAPYLFHIVTTLEQQQMPGELALLPMIESGYKPLAISNRGCTGLWQIGKPTGKRFHLIEDKWYDGRLDIVDSTNAAISYLKFLHKTFNHDWLLAIAAYNCGEGTVKKAIIKNKRAGLPTDYWSLPLPQQTKDFVPKLLAAAYLIKNYQQYNLKLHPISNNPYFTTVYLPHPAKINTIAAMYNIEVKELTTLNPGLILQHTHPTGPHKILIPEAAMPKLAQRSR